MKTTKIIVLATLVLGTVLFSCSNDQDVKAKQTDKKEIKHHGQASVKDDVSDPNILQVAMSLDDFTTLVIAIKAAGVEDALVNRVTLTVFAPINSAFAKLPKGNLKIL